MINNIYVEMLATKIFNKEINPATENPFILEDIKKEEYKAPVQEMVDKFIKEEKPKEVQ